MERMARKYTNGAIRKQALSLRMAGCEVTLSDIARRLGCSVALVCRRVHQNPDLRDYLRILNDGLRQNNPHCRTQVSRVFSSSHQPLAIPWLETRRNEAKWAL